MQDIKDFYILGLPIETEIGTANFIKVKDYPDYIMDLQSVGMSKLEMVHKYSQLNTDGSLDELIEELKSLSLYEISIGLPDLRQAYYNVYMKVFGNEDVVGLIGEENFDYIRSLVLTMNCIQEEKINPNPEIQRAIERSKRVKAQNQGKLTFSDMCSSIVAHSSIDYSEMNNWTIYQLYMTFYRIGQIKNYDTSTLFATVSEKADIESWSKHIDLFEEESHVVDRDKFKKSTGEMLS